MALGPFPFSPCGRARRARKRLIAESERPSRRTTYKPPFRIREVVGPTSNYSDLEACFIVSHAVKVGDHLSNLWVCFDKWLRAYVPGTYVKKKGHLSRFIVA